MSAVADKLREARALIEKPGTWSQGYVGRCADGEPVDFEDFDTEPVVAFCAEGAIIKACGGVAQHWAAVDLLGAAIRDGGDYKIVGNWNDTPGRTQAEVLAAFDKAIELAEAQDA